MALFPFVATVESRQTCLLISAFLSSRGIFRNASDQPAPGTRCRTCIPFRINTSPFGVMTFLTGLRFGKKGRLMRIYESMRNYGGQRAFVSQACFNSVNTLFQSADPQAM